jgi:hypothetical protein
MQDLTEAIVRLERIQNDLRTIVLYPTLADDAEGHLEGIITQITILDLRIQRWLRPAMRPDDERRRLADRRRQERRQLTGVTA